MPNIPTNILITGGADGLGKALTAEFLGAGAERVTVLDIDSEKGELLAKEHPAVQFHRCDLATFDPAALPFLIEQQNLETPSSVLFSGDPFDAVICNAGISACGNFRDTPWETEEKLFEVNLFGHMRLIKTLLQKNGIAEGARLAFTASASVFTPFPLAVAYAATKAGLDGFANALEPYLIPQKISVSRIYPGTIRTAHQQKYYAEMDPSTGSTPESVARAAFKGILKRKRHIYPDKMGKSFRALSRFLPWAMPKLTHKATKKFSAILYPDEKGKDPESPPPPVA